MDVKKTNLHGKTQEFLLQIAGLIDEQSRNGKPHGLSIADVQRLTGRSKHACAYTLKQGLEQRNGLPQFSEEIRGGKDPSLFSLRQNASAEAKRKPASDRSHALSDGLKSYLHKALAEARVQTKIARSELKCREAELRHHEEVLSILQGER
jgi:hypothetical protein